MSPIRGTFCRLKVQDMSLEEFSEEDQAKQGSADVEEHSGNAGGLSGGYLCPLGPANGHTWSWSIQGLQRSLIKSLSPFPFSYLLQVDNYPSLLN